MPEGQVPNGATVPGPDEPPCFTFKEVVKPKSERRLRDETINAYVRRN